MTANRNTRNQNRKPAAPAVTPTPAAQAPAPVTVVQTPAPVVTPAPAPAAPAVITTPRTLADISADILKTEQALRSIPAGLPAAVRLPLERHLEALQSERAHATPAPAPRTSTGTVSAAAVTVTDITPPAADATGLVTATIAVNGKAIGILTLPAKDFKTGSKGYYANGKVEIGGKRYQTQVQLVEIGSKPDSEAAH